MNVSVRWATAASTSVLFAMTGIAACGGSDDDSSAEVAPASAATPATSATEPAAVDTGWQDDVAAYCDRLYAALDSVPAGDESPAGMAAFITGTHAAVGDFPGLDTITVPADMQEDWDHIVAIGADAAASLDAAAEAVAAGDAATAEVAFGEAGDALDRTSGLIALAGAQCGEATPERTATAALNIPTGGDAGQIATGFDSIWVSETGNDRVLRVDPTSGEIIATIEVGAGPLKLQPADGRMWVRTRDEYVAIDPATNSAVERLAKADVGPAANRSWVVDGAMWICDGQRLHRYDTGDAPAGRHDRTRHRVWSALRNGRARGRLELQRRRRRVRIVGGSPRRSRDERNEEGRPPRRRGHSRRAHDVVFFPGNRGDGTAVVVDRATATVTATPDLGRPTAGSLIVSDGERIYVPTFDELSDVLVVDASDFTVTDTLTPLGNQTLALLDGSLWSASSRFGMLQRHDDVTG